jgi:CO dehydrogenase nickel-insertion accessory protein CooC1
VKVAKQIKRVCDATNANYGFIINKYQTNTYTDQLYEEIGDKIVGSIAYDEGIFNYQYDNIAETVKSSIHTIYQEILAFKGFNLDERMRKLYAVKEQQR